MISKPTTATTKTFRFQLLYKDLMDKLSKNHWMLHIELQTDEAEYKILICYFRLGTWCVSLRRDRRYLRTLHGDGDGGLERLSGNSVQN